MRQKKTPVHFLCCNAAMQSLATMMCQMESVEFQVTLMLPPGDDKAVRKAKMKDQIVQLSESLGGSHIDLDVVVDLWDSIKEEHYSSIDPTSQAEPCGIDLCFAATDDAISMVLNFMER